ncbi:MAG: hypothetical protein ABIE42_01580 [Candidatus Eisenbacteria bacterium]
MAGVVARKRKRIIRAFREHGATSPETAKSLVEVGLSDGFLVHVMKLRHVIVNVGGDRFYLDTAREQAVERTRRVVLAVVVLLVAAIIVVLWRMSLL